MILQTGLPFWRGMNDKTTTFVTKGKQVFLIIILQHSLGKLFRSSLHDKYSWTIAPDNLLWQSVLDNTGQEL